MTKEQSHEQALIYAEELSGLYQQEKERANDLEGAKERLEEAIARMQEAEKIRDEFIQNCSHELRTPLSPILGWAAFLKNGRVKPEDVQGVGETIERQAKRLLSVVDSLLMVADLSRQSPRTLDQEPIDVDNLFAEAIRRLQLDPPPHVEIAQDAHRFQGNLSYLSVVMVHLLDNATKFAAGGGPPELRATRDGDVLDLCVVDRGPGIPPGQRERILGAFVQGDGSTTRSHDGLGLGLYVCDQIIRNHGGELQLIETPGGGTTAIARIPQRRHIDRLAAAGDPDAVPED